MRGGLSIRRVLRVIAAQAAGKGDDGLRQGCDTQESLPNVLAGSPWLRADCLPVCYRMPASTPFPANNLPTCPYETVEMVAL